MAKPENSGRDQGRFTKGRSGNPKGKPRGTRNKASVILDRLADAKAEEILAAVINAALAGDVSAQRAILDRIWPARKGRPVRLDLRSVETAEDVAQAMSGVIAAMSEGQVTPDEAQVVVGVLEHRQRLVELVELEQRVAALEDCQK